LRNPIFSYELLYELYITKRKSINKISKEIKITPRTISKLLFHYQIPQRNPSEARIGTHKKIERVIHKLYYCSMCGGQIHWSTGLYGDKCCVHCNGLKKRNPDRHVAHYCIDCQAIISYACWKTGEKRCMSCATKEQMKDPTKHYNWQGGKSFELYPIEFSKELKEQIRKRDNYHCALCHCFQDLNIRVLAVHHIDYNKQNCNEDNLISLCDSCHMKTNFNRDYWIERFMEIRKNKIWGK